MVPSAIQVLRYGVIPLVGAVAGGAVVLRIARGRRESWIEGTTAPWILLTLGMSALMAMGWMVTARYISWHSFVFDLGSYDQKVWLISQQSTLRGMWQQAYKDGVGLSPCGIERYWGICHFQPWLLMPGMIYKVWDSPVVLLWCQVLLVVSGVVPVFLLARDRFHSPGAAVVISALYLLYPAVQYNGVVDYRPDHVAIATMPWAYLFAARGRYVAALGIAGLGGLAKETLILNGAFFGLYLAVRHRQCVLGVLAFAAGLAAFYVVTFHLLQFSTVSEGERLIRRFYPELSAVISGASGAGTSPGAIVRRVVEGHKLLYLSALFAPLALLPFLAWPELIPAIPSLAMSLLSTDPNLASIESQYSASVVGPAFAAFVAAVPRLVNETKWPAQLTPALTGLVVFNLFVSLGLSPSVLSLNFWNPQWGGRWQEAQYRQDRQGILDQAARLIPSDPEVTVVTQNDVNSARLAHRRNFFAFPYGIERADYVLLDTEREPYVHSTWNPQRYQASLKALLSDPAYTIVFDRDGVLLFQHRPPSRAHLGATPPN